MKGHILARATLLSLFHAGAQSSRGKHVWSCGSPKRGYFFLEKSEGGRDRYWCDEVGRQENLTALA